MAAVGAASSLALDCEGEALSRTGRLCVLQLATEAGHVFVIDVLSDGGQRAVQLLKPRLESATVVKVLHDCRRDADALLHQCGVRLRNVFDTQAAYALLRACSRPPPAEGRGRQEGTSECAPLSQLMRAYLGASEGAKESISAQMGDDRAFWARRPLTPSQVRYAASDVAHLLGLRQRLLLELDFHAAGGYLFRAVAIAARRREGFEASAADDAAEGCAPSPLGKPSAMHAAHARLPTAEEAAAESSRLRTLAEHRSTTYLQLRDHVFAVSSVEQLKLHDIVPGLVSNVSKYGLPHLARNSPSLTSPLTSP